MGIGYEDSIVLYNRYVTGVMESEVYIGTRFDRVRVELTQGANVRKSGIENADACLVKIPNESALPKPYKAPEVWSNLEDDEKQKYFTLGTGGQSFLLIVKKEELGIDLEAPVGIIQSDLYQGGFYNYIRSKCGYAYAVNTVDVYRLIPRFEVSGK